MTLKQNYSYFYYRVVLCIRALQSL